MSLDFDVLFACELDAVAEAATAQTQCDSSISNASQAYTTLADHGNNGLSTVEDDIGGGPVTDQGLPFGMTIDTYAEDTIKLLLQERDMWKAHADKQTATYEELERRVYKNTLIDADLPTDIINRLHRLESDVVRLRLNNSDLREKRRTAECELVARESEVTGQKNRLKGAGKKVHNAKDIAGKQEEKAKTAVQGKKSRIASERKMKQERDEAAAEAQFLKKQCEGLQAELDIEVSGRPHLRAGDAASDVTNVVIPITIGIRRTDFLRLLAIFEANQSALTEKMQHQYDDHWKRTWTVAQNFVTGREDVNADLDQLYLDEGDDQQSDDAEHDVS